MAICSSTTLPAGDTTVLVDFRPPLLAVISVADDLFVDGLIGAPLKRPPRSLI